MSEFIDAACVVFPDGMVHWCMHKDQDEILAAIKRWMETSDSSPGPSAPVVAKIKMTGISFLHAQAMNFDQLDDVDGDPDPGALDIVEDSEADTIEIEGQIYSRDSFRRAKNPVDEADNGMKIGQVVVHVPAHVNWIFEKGGKNPRSANRKVRILELYNEGRSAVITPVRGHGKNQEFVCNTSDLITLDKSRRSPISIPKRAKNPVDMFLGGAAMAKAQ